MSALSRLSPRSEVLGIAPPLPCATEGPDGKLCLRAARSAFATPLPNGQYLILPMCERCVRALAELYGVLAPPPDPPT